MSSSTFLAATRAQRTGARGLRCNGAQGGNEYEVVSFGVPPVFGIQDWMFLYLYSTKYSNVRKCHLYSPVDAGEARIERGILRGTGAALTAPIRGKQWDEQASFLRFADAVSGKWGRMGKHRKCHR